MTSKVILGSHRLEIETGGFVRFDVQPTNSSHRHDYFEFCLVLEGAGIYYHGGRAFELKPGIVFLAEPGVTHEITSFVSRDLFLYFVTLNVHKVSGAPAGKEDAIVDAFLAGHTVAAEGAANLERYAPMLGNPEPGREYFGQELLRLFTLELMDVLSTCSALGGESGAGILDRAWDYIDRNLDKRIRVQEVAAEIGMSERTLRRRFRELSGTTIVEEINHRRMRLAAHRLLMGFGVAEVAEFCGITDPGQFTRAFQRAFGMSPKRFQQSYIPGTLAKRTRP